MARILVIDDDPLIRDMLTQVLQSAGHEVMTAQEGVAGTSLFRQEPTELVITDIIMPQKDGWEAISDLRGDFPDVKIIAISGGGKVGPYTYLMIARRFGADRIFSKPIERNKLLEAIKELLGGIGPRPDDDASGERRGVVIGTKKDILLVDGDPDHARNLADALTRAGHRVIDTSKPEYAFEFIRSGKFDVAILDVLATRLGERDLMEALKKSDPAPQVIVMADFEALAVRNAVTRRGADHFIRKPVNINELNRIVNPPPEFSARMEGIDFLEYMEFMLMTRRKTVVEVLSEAAQSCLVYLNEGDVVHADNGQDQGEEAFYQCLSSRGGTFASKAWSEPERISIDKKGEFLLMEAARRRDEAGD